MSDYYLRTNTEAQMYAAFASIGIDVQGVDGECHSLDGNRIDIGWIGPVTWIDPVTGQTQTDGRFHANLRVAGELTSTQIAALPILDPPPSHPMRVWA
jgi:hypothetical protein